MSKKQFVVTCLVLGVFLPQAVLAEVKKIRRPDGSVFVELSMKDGKKEGGKDYL